jgi:NAD(P)H dehydrogenase (quinone)
MNTLIITAHPSSRGFTHKIAESYKQGKLLNGHTVEILDLYSAPRQDFLVFENKHEERADQIIIRDQMQQKISWADELVFVHPLWWGGAPAIMKNWIDVNFSSGFSHRYENGKAVKMLTGKTARVFITCDAPAFIYNFLANPFKSIWSIITFGYVGIKCKSIVVFGGKRSKKPEEIERFLEKVKQLGQSN